MNIDHNDLYASVGATDFEFADCIVLSFGQPFAKGFDIEGSDGDDILTGTNAAGRINRRKGSGTLIGGAGVDTGRGLTLHMDHGAPSTADDSLNQVKFSGIVPSFAFVAEPQTNGVAERFNRTLKEQAICGRVVRNIEEARTTVTKFKDRYNRHWRLEKLGFMSPLEARQDYAMRKVD